MARPDGFSHGWFHPWTKVPWILWHARACTAVRTRTAAYQRYHIVVSKSRGARWGTRHPREIERQNQFLRKFGKFGTQQQQVECDVTHRYGRHTDYCLPAVSCLTAGSLSFHRKSEKSKFWSAFSRISRSPPRIAIKSAYLVRTLLVCM